MMGAVSSLSTSSMEQCDHLVLALPPSLDLVELLELSLPALDLLFSRLLLLSSPSSLVL